MVKQDEVINMIIGPKKSVAVLIPMELYEKVKEQARERYKTIPWYSRQVLKRYLWYVENEPNALVDEWKIR